jgi:hypothetical protein
VVKQHAHGTQRFGALKAASPSVLFSDDLLPELWQWPDRDGATL